MKKIVITVIGADKVGIIASVSRYLADHDINILGISQTVMDGIFTMTLMCDMDEAKASVQDIQKAMKDVGTEIGVEIRAQLADIFYAMHRI